MMTLPQLRFAPMKTILTIIFSLTAVVLFGQRKYTSAQIVTIDGTSDASGGDLYHDTTSNVLYIGLMTGKLVAIQNTDNQDLTLTGTTLNLTGDPTGVDISSIDINVYEDDGTLTGNRTMTQANNLMNFSGVTGTSQGLFSTSYLGQILHYQDGANQSAITNISTGINFTLSGNKDFSLNNDPGTLGQVITSSGNNQAPAWSSLDLSRSGNILSFTNDPTTVDLSSYLDNTDNQDLSLTGNTLSLTNDGTTVDLSAYLDNSDNQDLSLTGNTLSLTNDGTTVDLSSYLDNTDNQTLSYTNSNPDDNINTLQIQGSAVFNIDDNHLGTNNQTLTGARVVTMSGSSLTFDGTQDVIIEADGDVGIGTITPGAKLDVDNGSVRFSDYGIGTYLESLPAVNDAVHHLAVAANGDIVETNTVKASKIFYPPAIVIDVSTVSTGESIDLYQEYVNRFGSPTLSSPSAPGAIPTYLRSELFYYVTDLDTNVFSNYTLDDNGNFNYDVASVPSGNCTFINVVFVVK